MKTGTRALLLTLLIIWEASNSLASGIDKLMKYAVPDGAMGNINKGAIIKDQQGGYMTGGSMLIRGAKPKTLQPLLIQTPKFAYDACTGSADFRFGGLSYIAQKEFTQFFKNTATAAAGSYGMKLLIKSSCPQCENIMSDLEAIARDINGMIMEQCSMAQMISGGMYNTLNSGNQQKCLVQGNIDKSSKDMYEASDKCKTNPDRHGTKGEEDELKSLLGNEFNLVWKALGKGSSGDESFKEMIMSVSGTIIGRKVEGSYHFANKPSLILNNDLLEQYIGVNRKSGKVKLYQCDTKEKCLSPVEAEVALTDKDTIYGNVTRILEKLVPKVIENRGELTDEEQAVIAFSSIPLLQLIEMEVVHKAKSEDMIVRMTEFIEVVCYDIVTNFLLQMVSQAHTAVAALEYAQLDNSVIKNFTANANQVRRFLTDAKFTAFKRLQVITQVKERLTQQQREFKAGFGRFLEYNSKN